MVPESEKTKVIASATRTLELSDRNACDVELLQSGGFSPLKGFMDEETYTHCVKEMRLPGSNLLFGMPIVLDTNCADTKVGDKVLLKYQGKDVAVVAWPSCATVVGMGLCQDPAVSELALQDCPEVCAMEEGEWFRFGIHYKDALKRLSQTELSTFILWYCGKEADKLESPLDPHPHPMCDNFVWINGTHDSLAWDDKYLSVPPTYLRGAQAVGRSLADVSADGWCNSGGFCAGEVGTSVSCGEKNSALVNSCTAPSAPPFRTCLAPLQPQQLPIPTRCQLRAQGLPGCQGAVYADAVHSLNLAAKCSLCPDVDLQIGQVAAGFHASESGVGLNAEANLINAQVGNFQGKLGLSIDTKAGVTDGGSVEVEAAGFGLQVGRTIGFDTPIGSIGLDLCIWCDDD